MEKKSAIKRVLQRKEDRNNIAGHDGSMSKGIGKGAGSYKDWKRSGDSLTPRKA